MPAKSNTFINDLLRLIFNAVNIPNIADNAGTSPYTNLYLALHTANPSASGNQSSSETNYVGYARQAVPRTAGGFVVTGQTVKLNSQVNFPDPLSGTPNQTITHWSIGVAGSGSSEILYFGPVAPNIPISFGLAGPALATGTTITEQ